MRPTLFSVNLFGIPLEFHAYTVFLTTAFVLATVLAVRDNYRRPQPYPVTTVGGIWVFVGALIGARLYWTLQYASWREIPRALFFWEGGLVFYGGVIGGTLAAIAYLKYCGVPFRPMADIAVPYVPLTHALARIGCFLNGCCYGAPTQMFFGVTYPPDSLPAEQYASTPLHPVQLYESAGLLIIFGLLYFLRHRWDGTGATLWLYLTLYGVLRFFTEVVRGDVPHDLWGMTVSQVVALGLFLGGGMAYMFTLRAQRHHVAGTFDASGEISPKDRTDSEMAMPRK
jgi:phosphatidylglycerol:prolipoprotein diacylglycerol transferase